MSRAGFKPGIYDSLLLEFAVAYKPTQPPRLDRSCSLCLSLFPPVGLFMGILQTKGESEKERKRFSKFYIRPFLLSALVYACSLVCRTRWLQIFEIYFSLSLCRNFQLILQCLFLLVSCMEVILYRNSLTT